MCSASSSIRFSQRVYKSNQQRCSACGGTDCDSHQNHSRKILSSDEVFFFALLRRSLASDQRRKRKAFNYLAEHKFARFMIIVIDPLSDMNEISSSSSRYLTNQLLLCMETFSLKSSLELINCERLGNFRQQKENFSDKSIKFVISFVRRSHVPNCRTIFLSGKFSSVRRKAKRSAIKWTFLLILRKLFFSRKCNETVEFIKL